MSCYKTLTSGSPPSNFPPSLSCPSNRASTLTSNLQTLHPILPLNAHRRFNPLPVHLPTRHPAPASTPHASGQPRSSRPLHANLDVGRLRRSRRRKHRLPHRRPVNTYPSTTTRGSHDRELDSVYTGANTGTLLRRHELLESAPRPRRSRIPRWR